MQRIIVKRDGRKYSVNVPEYEGGVVVPLDDVHAALQAKDDRIKELEAERNTWENHCKDKWDANTLLRRELDKLQELFNCECEASEQIEQQNVKLKADIDTLTQELARVKSECANWKQIVVDHCDEDTEFRKAAGDYDKSDSYGVEPHTEILERVKQAHADLLKEATWAMEGLKLERAAAWAEIYDTDTDDPMVKGQLSGDSVYQRAQAFLRTQEQK